MFAFLKRKSTICEWKDAYLQDCAAHNVPSTCAAKAFAFRMLLTDFPGDKPVNTVTKPRVLVFLSRVAQKRSGGSANAVKKQLTAAWTWGMASLSMPKENPFRVAKFPQDEHPRYMPPLADFTTVHNLTTGVDYAMLLTALHTAARRGEIFRLTWDDVDFKRRLIRLGTRKRAGGGMQYDWIPLTSALSDALSALKQESTANLVFPRPDGKAYLTRSHFLKKLCAEAGVKRFGYHSIRHLSASMMAKNLLVTEIQAILRHKSLLTTILYLHRLGYGVKGQLDNIFDAAV
jgi:integrase